MKYIVCDKHEDITSPHTNKKYINTVSPWCYQYEGIDLDVVNTYYMILDCDRYHPEGEVIFIEFDKNDVDTSAPTLDFDFHSL